MNLKSLLHGRDFLSSDTLMIFHDEPFFHIYFGDAADNMHLKQCIPSQDIFSFPKVKEVVHQFQLKQLYFLHQIHQTQGLVITSQSAPKIVPFSCDGDFLITAQSSLGLGIIAADCLPLICFDRRSRAIGIAHAGWRGAVKGISGAMIEAMRDEWGTLSADCIFFFGPSAKRCCYQVGDEFGEHLEHYSWRDEVLQRQATGLYFDLPRLVTYQLYDKGVAPQAIKLNYNSCTMCDKRFFSHRKSLNDDSLKGKRQMTIVALK